MSERLTDEALPVTVTYTNWRGETATRKIIPRCVWFGSTEWHPEPQWLVKAWDVEKCAERDFALVDFGCRATPADDLRAENERLRQALGFYAAPRNWIDSPEWDGPGTSTPKAVPVMNEPFGSRPCDCGDTARAALSQPAPTESMAADNAIGNLNHAEQYTPGWQRIADARHAARREAGE